MQSTDQPICEQNVISAQVTPLHSELPFRQASIVSYFRRSTGDSLVAEDLAQEVMLKVCRNSAVFDALDEQARRVYLQRTVKSVLADFTRSRERQEYMRRVHNFSDSDDATILEALTLPQLPPMSQTDADNEFEAILEVAQLSQSQELDIRALYADPHMAYKSIARRRGCHPNTIKSSIWHARRRLQELSRVQALDST